LNKEAAKIRKELKEIENYRKKLRCSRCGSRNVYTLKNKTKICRVCGNEEKL